MNKLLWVIAIGTKETRLLPAPLCCCLHISIPCANWDCCLAIDHSSKEVRCHDWRHNDTWLKVRSTVWYCSRCVACFVACYGVTRIKSWRWPILDWIFIIAWNRSGEDLRCLNQVSRLSPHAITRNCPLPDSRGCCCPSRILCRPEWEWDCSFGGRTARYAARKKVSRALQNSCSTSCLRKLAEFAKSVMCLAEYYLPPSSWPLFTVALLTTCNKRGWTYIQRMGRAAWISQQQGMPLMCQHLQKCNLSTTICATSAT